MAVQMADMNASPIPQKKRRAPDIELDDSLDIESMRAWGTPTRKTKKARFRSMDEDASDYALSTAASVADTNAISISAVDTDTPITDATSARGKTKQRPKVYKCTFPDCNKAFDRPVRLQTHVNSHTGERPHACKEPDCDKSFLKPEHLNRHMKEKHSNQSFTCDYNIRKDDIGTIGPCGKTFESANKLKRHRAMHEEKEETTCSWEGCGKVFRRQETLQRHIKKDHLGEDSWICTRETADGEACGQCFPTPGQLKGHEAREHEAPRYVCETCTNAMAMPDDETPAGADDLDPAFLPSVDDYEQHDGGDFDSDILRSLSLEERKPASSQYRDGAVTFPTYHDLQRHQRDVHPPTCDHCGKKCRSTKDLRAHMEIEHDVLVGGSSVIRPPEKKFICPYDGCPRSSIENGFTKKGNMEAHIKSAHTKVKEFVCGTFDLKGVKKVDGWNGHGCGLALGTKQSLIGHIRTQHLGLAAEIGKRTGLKEKDRKRRVRSGASTPAVATPDDDMEMDQELSSTTDGPSKELALLTGAGYNELRPYACLLAGGQRGCQMRFTNEDNLCSHLELTHGWNVDDVQEAIERGDTRPRRVGEGDDEILGSRLEADPGAAAMLPRSTDAVIDPLLNGMMA